MPFWPVNLLPIVLAGTSFTPGNPPCSLSVFLSLPISSYLFPAFPSGRLIMTTKKKSGGFKKGQGFKTQESRGQGVMKRSPGLDLGIYELVLGRWNVLLVQNGGRRTED